MDIDFKNKFSFAQMTSNSDGKTSGSGSMGCLIIVTGCVGFLAGIAYYIFGDKNAEIMMYSTGFIGAGATLLGVRKTKDVTVGSAYAEKTPEVIEEPTEEMLKS